MTECTCKCGSKSADPRFKELDAIIAKHREEAGALIPVLHAAQQLFGYLPREVMEYIARELNVPASEVYGVVTFYSYFSTQPIGKYKIGVCLGTACYVKGSGLLLEELKKQLGIDVGQTTPDGLFTLEATRCIGACGLAPVIAINDQVYGRLTSKDLAAILEEYRQREGQVSPAIAG
ncbi:MULTISPECIES: NADH-quinone oxidoreductase subunit NuoE [unclassified Carboxydocella]|uniref:NADH-quinone oxidoreductase subunit NuoE n=1 Tax=unclassified Carboxydocella TaxID=2685367 RepID=UPI0009AC73E8|nr:MULTISPECIES: NADH-quinone oxidoreductase subunit NuoE [unclassified Carboxydocella]GAW29250.1 hypothetical protein ULO1_18200 [Carboxydocella sp. ULO1]GAW30242.1 hypothetical protein JDF658_00070 [Carboxydocella sp. JDF658]